MRALWHPTLDHPTDEDLSLGTLKPQKQRRGEGGAPRPYTISENAQSPVTVMVSGPKVVDRLAESIATTVTVCVPVDSVAAE
jgi:hypothetical protein